MFKIYCVDQPTKLSGREIPWSSFRVTDPEEASRLRTIDASVIENVCAGSDPLEWLPTVAAFLQEDGCLACLYTVPGDASVSVTLPAGSFSLGTAPADDRTLTVDLLSRLDADERQVVLQQLAEHRAELHDHQTTLDHGRQWVICDRGRLARSRLHSLSIEHPHLSDRIAAWLAGSDDRLYFVAFSNYADRPADTVSGSLPWAPKRNAAAFLSALTQRQATQVPGRFGLGRPGRGHAPAIPMGRPRFTEIGLTLLIDSVSDRQALRAQWVRLGGFDHLAALGQSPASIDDPVLAEPDGSSPQRQAMTATSLLDVFLQPTGRLVDLSAVEVIDPAHRDNFATLEDHAVFRFLSGSAPLDTFPAGSARLQDDGSLHVLYTVPGASDVSYRLPAGSFECPPGLPDPATPFPDPRTYARDRMSLMRAELHRELEASQALAVILLYDRSHGALSALSGNLKQLTNPPPIAHEWLISPDSELLFIFRFRDEAFIGTAPATPDDSAPAVVAALRDAIATLDAPPFDQVALSPQGDDLSVCRALVDEWVRAGGRRRVHLTS